MNSVFGNVGSVTVRSRVLLAASAFFLLLQISDIPAFAADYPVISEHSRHLPVENFNSPERLKAFADAKDARIKKYRSLYGTKNGLLLGEVQSDMQSAFSDGDLARTKTSLEEWLQLYPKVPVDCQRALARHALYLAQLMLQDKGTFKPLGNRMIDCVLDVSENACWYKTPDLRDEFARIAATTSLDAHRRAQAVRAMGSEPSAKVMSVDKLVKTIEDKLQTCLSDARTEVQPVDYAPYEETWLKGKNYGGAKDAQTVTTEVLSSSNSAILLGAITELIPLYDSLQDSDKQIFSARIMECNAKLQWTNLQIANDTLFWNVFRAINPFWLHGNQNLTAVLNNSTFYQQTCDFPKAEKVIKKVLEIEDIFEDSQATEVNLHIVYGDLLDKMGRHADSLEQYEIARTINSKLRHSGVFAGLRTEGLDSYDKSLDRRLHPNEQHP